MIVRDLYSQSSEILGTVDAKIVFYRITEAMGHLNSKKAGVDFALPVIQSWEDEIHIKNRDAVLYMIRAQELYRTHYFDEGQKYESLAVIFYLSEENDQRNSDSTPMPSDEQIRNVLEEVRLNRLKLARLQLTGNADLFEKTRQAHNKVLLNNRRWVLARNKVRQSRIDSFFCDLKSLLKDGLSLKMRVFVVLALTLYLVWQGHSECAIIFLTLFCLWGNWRDGT